MRTPVGPPPPGRLLRAGLPRDPSAVRHLVAFAVAAVATILITRGYLAATGYPQIGGGGLHIAHVLWGGLLLVVAMVLLLSFAGPVVRPVGAIVGGVGFGFFIDEVGKFVTTDNDYFYRPAAAIIYVALVGLLLVVHVLHGRRTHHPAEHLAGAVDYAVAGVAGGFDAERRDRAARQLDAAGDAPGADRVAALLAAVPDDPYELPDPVGRVAAVVRAVSRRVLGIRATRAAAVAVLAVQAAGALVTGPILAFGWVFGMADVGADESRVAVAGTAAGGVLAAAFTATGLFRLRTEPVGAYRWFQRGVLVNLLLTQVFQFAASELRAGLNVAVDLALLAVVGAELGRLRAAAPPAGPGRSAAPG